MKWDVCSVDCVLAPFFSHTASSSWRGTAHSPDSIYFSLPPCFLLCFPFLGLPSTLSLLNSHSTVHSFDVTILASLPRIFPVAHQILFLFGAAWVRSWVFFTGFAQYLILEPLFQYFCISVIHQINGTHFKASWKESALLHQHSYTADHGKEESTREPTSGLFWTFLDWV